ncbi:hypothetical protein P8882_18415 [Bacillus haynesii]|nr:hypothetical protein [Bacillus haynesii]
MHSLFLLFKRDLALGFHKMKKMFIILFFVGLFNFLYPLYFIYVNMPDSSIAFWDIIGKTFLGVPVELVRQHTFEFPFGWLLLQLSGAILINTYIKDDLFSHSAFVRIRAKSIFKLWVSKLLFSCITIIVFYFVLLFITWWIWKLSGHTTEELTVYGEMLLRYSPFRLSTSQLVIYSIVLNISGTFLVTFIFSFLTLIFKTIYSFVICSCILFLSIFSNNPILLGNESMLIRHPIFSSSPVVSVCISLVIVLTLCIIFLIGGGLYLSKCELISDAEVE